MVFRFSFLVLDLRISKDDFLFHLWEHGGEPVLGADEFGEGLPWTIFTMGENDFWL
jgi:hypothetical protein